MDLKKLYGTATSLGGTNASPSDTIPPRFETFWLCFRDGRKISYPYRFVGPMEIDEDEEHIVIYCTCDTYQSINVSGERLSVLVRGLDAATVDVIRETPRPDFVAPGGMVVLKIEVVRAENKANY
jgi:hypothetical protein